MILLNPYPKNFVCEDCGQQFERPSSGINPIIGGYIDSKCPKCGSKNVMQRWQSTIRSAVKRFFE